MGGPGGHPPAPASKEGGKVAQVLRFKCLLCGAKVSKIRGSPSECPCCRRTTAWITVAVEVKEAEKGDCLVAVCDGPNAD